jgi:hypothetical protein
MELHCHSGVRLEKRRVKMVRAHLFESETELDKSQIRSRDPIYCSAPRPWPRLPKIYHPQKRLLPPHTRDNTTADLSHATSHHTV